jgi:antitoxin HicB
MKYPFFMQKTERNYAATAVQFPTLATHTDRSELERLMAEGLALQLHDYTERGEQAPAPLAEKELDLSDYEGEDVEVVWVEPAKLNPVSLELDRAIRAAGLSEAEVARRTGTSRAAMTRVTNPFYWGHSLNTLRKLADALGVQLEVSLKARAA